LEGRTILIALVVSSSVRSCGHGHADRGRHQRRGGLYHGLPTRSLGLFRRGSTRVGCSRRRL